MVLSCLRAGITAKDAGKSALRITPIARSLTETSSGLKEHKQMQKTKIIYWVITGLMAAFMLMASIPDVLTRI